MGTVAECAFGTKLSDSETKVVNKFFGLPYGKPKNFEIVLVEI